MVRRFNIDKAGVAHLCGARRALANLLTLALLLRALIPVGFMPDIKGGNPFAVVICVGSSVTLTTQKSGAPLSSRDDKRSHAVGTCAFSGLIEVALAAPAEHITVLRQTYVVASALAAKAQLQPVTSGPAVGLRAPPQIG